ncbi:MAG: sensor histidine kinase [Clostridiales bacterium]|nr:sensor histidine kinase [Clostridiales bacterium]
MSESRRMTSTARSIKRFWTLRLIRLFIWLDILLIALAAVGFAHFHERAALGDRWRFNLAREFNLAEDGDLLTRVRLSKYAFAAPEDRRVEVEVRPFYDAAFPLFRILLIVEALSVLAQMLFGGKRARRLLRPLNEMARATRALLEKQQAYEGPPPAVDDGKLHELEDRIKSMRPEEKLHTGDRDLEGLEGAVNNLLTRLHESYRQQGQFVSDASHELRTPIAVIQGYAGMLDRWGKSDEKILDESIAAIKSESEYMRKLVDQLLFLARGDMGRSKLDFKRVNVSELVKEVYEDSILIDRAHDWRIDTEPDVLATADHDVLKQCARVLADNAAKYTPEGGMIRLRARRGDRGEARIEVQDSGIGIKREDVRRVFDRFYRSDPARARNSGGTGLGLSIARWIAESHGGHLEVLSREGIGTRFTVVLPPVK